MSTLGTSQSLQAEGKKRARQTKGMRTPQPNRELEQVTSWQNPIIPGRREIPPPPTPDCPKGILPIVAGAPRPKCVAYISVARVAVLLYWAIAISVGRTRDRWRLIKSWLITIVRPRLGPMTLCIGATANSIKADASGH